MSQIYAPGSIAGPPATFMGPYNAATSYSMGEAVSCGGSSYVSLVAANTGNNPATSQASWGLLAAAGSAGASLNTTLTFAAAGSQIVMHGLNTLAPIVQASVTAGATRWSGAAIDANNYQIIASGPMVASFTFLGGTTSTTQATTSTTNLTTGLTNYWPMTEGSGSTFIDAIAGLNLGSAGMTWVGGEATFSGSGSLANNATSPTPLATAASPFTISMWVNLPSFTNNSGQAWLIVNTALANGWVIGLFNTGQPSVLLAQGGSVKTIVGGPAPGLIAGARQNLIYTYDGSGHASGLKMYANGVLVVSTVAADSFSGTVDADQPFSIMGETNGSSILNSVAGSMDHLRIYNRVLAAGDIAAIQAGGN